MMTGVGDSSVNTEGTLPCVVFVFRHSIGTRNSVCVWGRQAGMGKENDLIRMEELY